ncbi:hypothetical protein F5X96DRAFT_635966 [Biscogniauxia mediterranea]|nr:hypothetical protein F5X96DRAFT_635966 [Biscogniauxia mediterranea]
MKSHHSSSCAAYSILHLAISASFHLSYTTTMLIAEKRMPVGLPFFLEGALPKLSPGSPPSHISRLTGYRSAYQITPSTLIAIMIIHVYLYVPMKHGQWVGSLTGPSRSPGARGLPTSCMSRR